MNTINNIDMNKNNKIELALASLMFFAPLVKKVLKSRNDVDDEDKIFVLWFIKLWYVNIALLISAIIIEIIAYMASISILDTCGTVIIVILAISLLIESLLVITEKSIIKWNISESNIASDKTMVSQIILGYIPLYNVYLWYKMHNFDGENLYLKESLVVWWLFSILLLMTSNKYILIGYVIIILMTMMLNIFQVQLWQSIENFIKNLFVKNPEEIRWSIVGVLIAPFVSGSVAETISSQKWKYSLIFKLDHKQILLELILMIILWGFGIYMWIKAMNYTLIVWIILILARYLIMLIKWKHMPHIPVIREITNIFFISKKA